MAFSGNYMCTSFKQELLVGSHNFTASSGDTFKLAMYSGTGYSAGGGTLTNVTPTTSGTTALTDFADLTFGSSTITARGALIYNTTTGGGTGSTDSIVVLDFGSDKSSSAGDFTIVFPTADASNAIIRIA